MVDAKTSTVLRGSGVESSVPSGDVGPLFFGFESVVVPQESLRRIS